MSFYDFFRRKPKSVQSKKSFSQNKVTTEDVKQSKSNISSFIKVTTQITPSVAEEIIPAEKRMRNAIASKHGLYPQEVLVLDYASSYYTEGNSF